MSASSPWLTTHDPPPTSYQMQNTKPLTLPTEPETEPEPVQVTYAALAGACTNGREFGWMCFTVYKFEDKFCK